MAVTVSDVFALCDNAPAEPVNVNGYVPIGVVAEVATVIVVLPEPETEVGLKLADAPVGRPLTLKPTLELKPPSAPTLTVYGVLPPCIADPEPGLTEIVKSVTLSVTDVVCVKPPLVPCTVIE